MRAQRARSKSRRDDAKVAQGKLRPTAAFAAWAVPREAYGVRAPNAFGAAAFENQPRPNAPPSPYAL
ncbi:hypothetical protein SBV1_740001 [Verrucomicrobia bacterium]|nr:hypothetical protein SBV1_740001 [Verrucomicrobiota bacterium]